MASDIDSSFLALDGRASERKARLFVCACCHRIKHVLSFPEFIQTVEVAERFADGLATEDECRRAHDVVDDYISSATPENDHRNTADMAVTWASAHYFGYSGDQLKSAESAASCARSSLRYSPERRARLAGGPPEAKAEFAHWPISADQLDEYLRQHKTRSDFEIEVESQHEAEEELNQVELLRDIFDSPFRPHHFESAWRTDTTVTLARQMYDSRDFSVMPILADALEDAGCGDADVLAHCRGPGPHVRGCWVVDYILCKG